MQAVVEVVDGVFKKLGEHDYPRNNHTYWYSAKKKPQRNKTFEGEFGEWVVDFI